MKINLKFIVLPTMILIAFACSSKSYVHYLVDPAVEVDEALVKDPGAKSLKPYNIGENKAIKVQWNDGKMYSQVDIPMVSSGQTLVIEHNKKRSTIGDKGPKVVLPAPNENDTAHLVLKNSYLSKGLKEEMAAPAISISKSKQLMEKAIKRGDYVLGLKYIEGVLARYPSYPEFLRAKGSVLLLLGEKETALEYYEKAQDIEYSPLVERKISQMRN